MNKIKEDKCIGSRNFHEWIVYEWMFNCSRRDGIISEMHPKYKTVRRVMCKYCLKIKDILTNTKDE